MVVAVAVLRVWDSMSLPLDVHALGNRSTPFLLRPQRSTRPPVNPVTLPSLSILCLSRALRDEEEEERTWAEEHAYRTQVMDDHAERWWQNRQDGHDDYTPPWIRLPSELLSAQRVSDREEREEQWASGVGFDSQSEGSSLEVPSPPDEPLDVVEDE